MKLAPKEKAQILSELAVILAIFSLLCLIILPALYICSKGKILSC